MEYLVHDGQTVLAKSVLWTVHGLSILQGSLGMPDEDILQNTFAGRDPTDGKKGHQAT